MKTPLIAQEYFFHCFGEEEDYVYFSHGRLEILGNHTDHNRGLVLCAGCDLGITAAVSEDEDDYVCVHSEGFKSFEFPLSDLSLRENELGTSMALVKGILQRMKDLGYKIGGFKMACVSDIFAGAGVSSSAAFESLIVKVIDDLYNGGVIAPLEMAKIGQYAENVYFGKPSGLLDQIGTSFGGLTYVDFKEDDPEVEPLDFPFHGLSIFLVNPGSSHEHLTPLYASIPSDMKGIAKEIFGKSVLREISREEFFRYVNLPTPGLSERAKLRATHFFEENNRVLEARRAIKNRDEAIFLDAINNSQLSSQAMLGNTFVPGQYEKSPQQAIDALKPFLKKGAIRIMGGGFAGSVIAFVHDAEKGDFLAAATQYFGKENVVPVKILSKGPIKV